MVKNGGCRALRRRAAPRVHVPLLLWAVAVMAGPAAAQPTRKAETKAKTVRLEEVSQSVNAVVEAQHSLAVALSQLRDDLNELQRSVDEGRDEVRQNQDSLQAAAEQIKGMREEIRGLYVESSGLKGDIAQVGKQVEGLDGNLGSFRLSAGIVVAVVIVLQVVLVGLMFRGRG